MFGLTKFVRAKVLKVKTEIETLSDPDCRDKVIFNIDLGRRRDGTSGSR